jgi:DnaA family protein
MTPTQHMGQQLLPLQPRHSPCVDNLPGLADELSLALRQLKSGTHPLCIFGEPGMGKTHWLLWAAFAEDAWAPYFDCRARETTPEMVLDCRAAPFLCLDNVDAWANREKEEETLFCLYNERQERGLPWLISCSHPPPQWRLPDWESRLAGFTQYRLEHPQDEQLRALIAAMALRFGTAFDSTFVSYLASRETRNLRQLTDLIEGFQYWLWQKKAAPSVQQWRLFHRDRNAKITE